MVTSFLPWSLPIIALFSKHQLGHPSHWLILLTFQVLVSNAPIPGISLTSLEALVHWCNHLFFGHYPHMTSFPSLPALDSKSFIIITTFHKLSTLLFLLILYWRSLHSQINPILSLLGTCNEAAESCRRKKKHNHDDWLHI